jgi:uncharacterized membrane protein
MQDALRRRVHALALALTVGLIVLVAGSILASGWSFPRLLLAATAAAPLAYGWIRLRGRERRVYAWMTLVVIPYIALALTEAVANPTARLWAGACVFTAFGLFVALIACLRATR